jgi:hypothetical protein
MKQFNLGRALEHSKHVQRVAAGAREFPGTRMAGHRGSLTWFHPTLGTSRAAEGMFPLVFTSRNMPSVTVLILLFAWYYGEISSPAAATHTDRSYGSESPDPFETLNILQ